MNLKQYRDFFKLSFWDKMLVGTEGVYNKTQKYLNFRGRYNFILDNRKSYENLLIIVAGYQDYLYDKVLNRVNKYLEKDIDVIVVTPGKRDDKLIEYCNKFGWSYLYTKDNKLALAQNIAIKVHPDAKFIYKMDEDIFITKGFFSKLKEKYIVSLKESEFIPGGIAPVININAFTYSFFLEKIGKKGDYINRFGAIKQNACYSIKGENIWYSGKIAEYLWENTLNIDDIQEKYFENLKLNANYIPNSIVFSIGCFMFTRELRKNMGGFNVGKNGSLAMEEKQYLQFCIWKNMPIILCENCLVGHFGFGPQKQEMKEYYLNNKDKF